MREVESHMSQLRMNVMGKALTFAAMLLFLTAGQAYAKEGNNGVEGRLDVVESEVDDLQGSSDVHDGRLAALEKLVKELQADRDSLKIELVALRAQHNTHEASASAHHPKTTSFAELTDDTAADAQIPNNITVDYAVTCGDADTVDGEHAAALDQSGDLATHAANATAHHTPCGGDLGDRVEDLEELLLPNFWRDGDDIYIEGANLHVINGSGSTDGTTNGLGNIIIGYNEERDSGDDRTGSHMLVVGALNNYSSYGGIVVGWTNTTSGPYSSVSGGAENTASEDHASVSGGRNNTASGSFASVSGGGGVPAVNGNMARGYLSSVSGGSGNMASNYGASVSGGQANTASGAYAWVSGGQSNTASGYMSSVSGGADNTARDGYAPSVSGGSHNTASGTFASVSGGFQRSVTGTYDWRAGTLFEDK